AMTGLNNEQLTDLVARLHELCGDKFVSAGRPLALGLFRSVALVVCLIRKNVTQDFAGAVFGVSQATVSRRWDLLRPLIGDASPTSSPIHSRSSAAERCWSTARCARPGTGATCRACSPPRPAIPA